MDFNAWGIQTGPFAAHSVPFIMKHFHLFHFHTGEPFLITPEVHKWKSGIHPTPELDEIGGYQCLGQFYSGGIFLIRGDPKSTHARVVQRTQTAQSYSPVCTYVLNGRSLHFPSLLRMLCECDTLMTKNEHQKDKE